LPNGDKYVWRNGKMIGKGIKFYQSGAKYEGDFKADIRDGNGI